MGWQGTKSSQVAWARCAVAGLHQSFQESHCKGTELPGQSVAPPLQLPCPYRMNPIAKHG